jgi:hypothetical protein
MPKRIQRKRTKGWKMPEGSVHVGWPTRWGNPYPVEVFGRAEAIRKFRGLFQHEQDNSTEFRSRPSKIYAEKTWCAGVRWTKPVMRMCCLRSPITEQPNDRTGINLSTPFSLH